jgi:hypothetical protein
VTFDPDSFDIGREEVLLNDVGFPTTDEYGEYRFYDVAPEGQRFIVLLEDQAPERAKMIVVLNWLEELKRLVPTGK